VNQALLANHQIISMFEKSKALADQIFDRLTGVFLYLDRDANILRANIQMATQVGLKHEDLLYATLSKFFSPENWNFFVKRFTELQISKATSVEFELPMSISETKIRDYVWQISPIELLSVVGTDPVFICLGRDITDVKAAQAKVFSIAKDLELAEAVQNLLLPQKREMISDKIEMAAFYKSASIAGGDFWAFDFVTKDKIWLLVGDVTGHGVGPAMVTAMVSGCYSTMKFAAQSGVEKVDLYSVLESINRRLLEIDDQPYWMTMVAVEIDLQEKSLSWWSAGAPPIYIVSADGELSVVSERSSPLGAGALNLSNGKENFVPGQRLLIFTDGLSELENATGSKFGTRGLKKYLVRSRQMDAIESRDALLLDIDTWRGKNLPDDDITYIILDRK
jgi:PAS domain S-box-containing protein